MSVSPAPSSPTTNFVSSSIAPTSVPSTPPSEDPAIHDSEFDTRQSSEVPDTTEDDQFRDRFARLERLLEKSFTYSNLLGEQMDKEKRTSALRAAMHVAPVSDAGPTTRKRATRKAPKRRVREESEEEAALEKRLAVGPASTAQDGATRPKFLQPALVTGGKLKDYQLEGVEWMVSLDKNGVSGILADEMGLGKTLQVIAFNAHLRELGHFRPFLVVCPLSVVHNWIDEFHRFAPAIPVCMYHGPPAERAELRRTVMREPDDGSEAVAAPGERIMAALGKSKRGRAKMGKSKAEGVTKTRGASCVKRRKINSGENDTSDTEDDQDEDEDKDDHKRIPTARHTRSPFKKTTLPRQTKETFPVVVTTYEMIIRDQPHLSKYNWGYIVVDEGHRLKNINCRLIQEIKKYPSAGRMILTGTPLHNNLAELWSLLNFILPDIFDDLDTFQEWFNLGTLQSRLSPTQSTHLISTLHGILKPFLLRRLKVDVEGLLPPKKEYVIYAPLSVKQRDLYDKIVEGRIRLFLIGKGVEDASTKKEEVIDVNAPRRLRRGKKRRYDLDGSDEEYFERMEKGEAVDGTKKAQEDAAEIGRQHHIRENVKGINNMRLQNTVMQLRKACSHPLLFRDPTEPLPETTEELVDGSGKMMLLERLLDELFRTKHKVLLFSQFTTMLDIIETWATELKGWHICRIDGSTSPLERREHMNSFQEGGKRANAPILFLLSTRAGGLGITLTAADTVIFYDQDWNPQMDIQAQDRAHRIGQTKPVLVFRLVTAHTIETRIMQRATEKRKLEALVIAKGKFKMPGQVGRTKADNIADMAAALLKLEGDHIEVVPETREGKQGVLSDRDLEMLLDRSDAVFTDRRKGWSSEGSSEKKAAFAVYEAPVHNGNELVAKIMGEDQVDDDLNRMTTCTCLIDLPTELLTTICDYVDCRTVVQCRSVCKRFRDVIDGSLELQYRIELAQDGMIDGRSVAQARAQDGTTSTSKRHLYQLTTGERLARLRQLRHAWQTLTWARCVTIPMPGPCCAYELVGGVFCKMQPGGVGGGGLGLGLGAALTGWNGNDNGNGNEIGIDDEEEDGDDVWDEVPQVLGSRAMYTTWLPGRGNADRGRTVVCDDLGIPTRDFAIDPSQDLMVLLTEGGEVLGIPVAAGLPGVLELHVRTLSTNEVHPEAREPVLCIQVSYPTPGVIVQIVDDVVGTMYGTHPCQPRITMWNWRTGDLIVDGERLPPGTRDFSFISSRALFFTTGQGGGTLELFTFTCDRADVGASSPSCDRPMSTLIHVATLHLPPIQPSVRLLSLHTHTGPFLATCPPDKLFMASNEARIHVVTIQYVQLPTPEGRRTHQRVCIFMHNRVLNGYVKRGLAHVNSAAGTIVAPWSEWGRTHARMLPYVGTFQWSRYVHGQRVVLLLPTLEAGKSMIQVLDFNVRGALTASADADPDAEGSTSGLGRSAIIDNPTLIVMPNIFVDVVESGLPYREVLREVRDDYSGAMIDDERLLGLKYPAFLTGDMKDIDVFTM